MELLRDDGEDEELEFVINGIPRRIFERMDYFNSFDEDTFYKRFRMCKDTSLFVLNLIEGDIEHPYDFNNSVAPINQLLVFLRVCATGSHLALIGDFSGMHYSTVSRIIRRVGTALARRAVHFIKMPATQEERDKENLQFFQKARFPRVIGVIDCTHIRIQSPGDSGYFQRPYLLTPLLNPQTRGQQLYNEAHIRPCNIIERVNGIIKRRFPILAYGCRLKLDTILTIIVALAVLHNICREQNEADPPDPEDLERFLRSMEEDLVPEIPPVDQAADIQAIGIRERIVNYFADLDR